jgi:hypothetical protein
MSTTRMVVTSCLKRTENQEVECPALREIYPREQSLLLMRISDGSEGMVISRKQRMYTVDVSLKYSNKAILGSGKCKL